jgi:dipeptidase
MTKDIEKVWKEIEQQAWDNQKKIEEEALKLFKENPQRAQGFLTEYCLDTAQSAVDAYWKLGDDLWTLYNRYF